MSPGRASEAQASEETDGLPQAPGWCVQDPELAHSHAGRGVARREPPLEAAVDVKTVRHLITEVCKRGKTGVATLRALFGASVGRKPAISEYEPDADLRDTAQVSLLENSCIEASVRRVGLADGLLKGAKA